MNKPGRRRHVANHQVTYDEKLIWTVCSGLLFFVFNEFPLYGVKQAVTETADPIFWLRPIFASTRGTLGEIGTIPIVTAGFIFQLLGGLQIIDVNLQLRTDRELYQTAQKLFAILLILAQSVAIVFSGVYGSAGELGASGLVLVISQLVIGGVFLLLIDETLQKGYGFSTGVSFFTTLAITTKFVWNTLSLSSQDIGRGKEFIGAIVGLVHSLITRNFKYALVESFYRTHLPNVFEVYGNILAFALVVYLLNFRFDINVKSTKIRTPSSNYPIRLLYTGNIPVYMFYSVVSNLFIFSNALYRLFPNNVVTKLLGTWERHGNNPQLFAVSGLCYYLQPPFTIFEALWDPIKTFVYVASLILSTIYLAKTWTEISGSSPRDVAKQFKDNDIVIVGQREVSTLRELKKIITPAASIGGALSAVVIVLPDLVGFTGSGLIMFVGASTIYTYFEILAQESGQPGFSVGNW